VRDAVSARWLYGLEWGDPETVEPLKYVRDRWIVPFVNPRHTAVEVGPGGGRWTRYLLGFERLYAVDYHEEMLTALRRNLRRASNVAYIKNSGTDFPGIPASSIHYLFSFGTFVHLDPPLIEEYLANMKAILRPDANVVLQYADKTKVMAQENAGFSDNTPDRMRSMVIAAGYRVLQEDVTTLWHSSLIRFESAH
jgi:ubiquinone/menaquinone biosynthesis C-methylase UbiE